MAEKIINPSLGGFGIRLHAGRTRMGLSRTELAELTRETAKEISIASISAWESGKRYPRDCEAVAANLAPILTCDAEWLAGGYGQGPGQPAELTPLRRATERLDRLHSGLDDAIAEHRKRLSGSERRALQHGMEITDRLKNELTKGT